jgi:hypothetical protein
MDDRNTSLPQARDDAEEPRVFKVAAPGARRAVLETIGKGAVVAAVAASCGKDENPAAPAALNTTTTAAALVWTLYGTVREEGSSRVVPGARLAILDGANANRTATTDGNGYYSMPSLAQGGFTVRVTADRYDSRAVPCTLTRDYQMDITLTLTPTTSTAKTTRKTTTAGCSCNSQCGCNPVHCGCNPLIYWYPN